MTEPEDIVKYRCPICGHELARVGHESGFPYHYSGCTHYTWVQCNDAVWSLYPEWCEEQLKNAIFIMQNQNVWYYCVPR